MAFLTDLSIGFMSLCAVYAIVELFFALRSDLGRWFSG